VTGRRLVSVEERRLLAMPADGAGLLPLALPERFDTAELAQAAGIERRLAQQRPTACGQWACSTQRASGAAPSSIGARPSEAPQSRTPNDSGGRLPQGPAHPTVRALPY
jgi:hypothetical protein